MFLDRRRLIAGALAAPALTLAARHTFAKAPEAGRQTPGLYRFKVGTFEVTAINDGMLNIPATVFSGVDAAEVERLLEAALLPRTAAPTAVNAYLVNTGDRLVLIDTGSAAAMGPTAGRLVANLEAAGVVPSAVDTVLLTHLHPDHSNGLLGANGSVVFPNAQVVVAEAEQAFWTDDAMLARAPADAKVFFEQARGVLKTYGGQVRRMGGSGEAVPGISAVPAPGHTPGHTMYRVVSGDAALLVWGDLVHAAALQLPRPEIAPSFDVDPARGVETRRRALDAAASDRVLVAGMHLAFPGIGQVAREGQAYRFVPAFWSPEL